MVWIVWGLWGLLVIVALFVGTMGAMNRGGGRATMWAIFAVTGALATFGLVPWFLEWEFGDLGRWIAFAIGILGLVAFGMAMVALLPTGGEES